MSSQLAFSAIDSHPDAPHVAGIDEAGRGPLAGPVFAAAVILDSHAVPHGLADSKTLSEAERERLYVEIMERAIAVGLGTASVAEIDRINILQATMRAMARAVAQLSPQPFCALVDGNRTPPLAMPATAVIGGDALEPAISAASIIAKVARDRHMRKLDVQFPHYGWAQNKGYGTEAHRQALAKFGPSPHHRTSFRPVQLAQR